MLYHSTRSLTRPVDSAEAVLEGLAPDGGLYMPESLPEFDWRDCLNEGVDYLELSRKFCEKIRNMGYRIVWDPNMIEKVE